MASAAMSTGEPGLAPPQMESREQFIRVIVADSQAIFRAGLRKIFAVEDDIRVVGQAETLDQAVSAAKKFSAEILIFEAALAENPIDAAQEILKQAPGLRLTVVTEVPDRELTLELFRRGVHAIVSREIDSALARSARGKVGARSLPDAGNTTARHALEGPAHAQGISDRFLCYAGNEEQRNCRTGRYD